MKFSYLSAFAFILGFYTISEVSLGIIIGSPYLILRSIMVISIAIGFGIFFGMMEERHDLKMRRFKQMLIRRGIVK